MASRIDPTVRVRRLAAALRQLRTDSGMTLEAVSAALEGDLAPNTISQLETGKRSVTVPTLRMLLDVYKVAGDEREALRELARQARQRGWWQQYRGDTVPEWFHAYIGLEAEASVLYGYEAELMPGLLQTDDYYRAFLRSAPAAGDEATIEAKVAVRAERRQRLDAADAPEFWAVINEAVIKRAVGGARVMAAQLRHAAGMAERDTVSVQVLPFAAGAHQSMESSFMLLGFPDPRDPDVAYIEYGMGSVTIEGQPHVTRFRAMFDHLRAQALDQMTSVARMRAAADALDE